MLVVTGLGVYELQYHITFKQVVKLSEQYKNRRKIYNVQVLIRDVGLHYVS